jgi:putative methionine-R-sulfoxide reductase with GAF domain
MNDNGEPDWPGDARASSDVAALRESLAAAELRAATLAELTAVMSEGRDPLALTQRAVEVTARATRADGAFVYIWDRDEERLVLRAATEGRQREHIDRIRLRMGEGVTGWSALMRQTVVLPRDPQKDPRFKAFPELRETTFHSMVAVPIVAPGAEVLGVFSVYAIKEEGFSPNDVSLASEVGTLLANGLIQAETVSQLRIQSGAAKFLCNLPDDTWGSLEQCAQIMARECALHLEADVCVIEVTADRVHPHGGTSVVAVSQRFRDEQNLAQPDRDLDRVHVSQVLAPLNLQRLRIPLGTAAPIGALSCYRARRFTPGDERLLEAIGAQIAAGVLSLFGSERVLPALEQLLTSPDPSTTEQLLRRHRWEPRAGWATLLRVQTGSSTGLRTVDDDRTRASVFEVLGGDQRHFLLPGGGRYLALAKSTEPAQREALIARISELGRQPSVRVTAGIGPLTTTPQETHRAIKHALVAAQWAELAEAGDGAVVRYEDVAHLRLLPRTALSMSANLKTLLDSLAALVRYDIENGADLGQTLDAFLANSGSVAKTSSQVYIHRNTLRQRIQRIEELIGQSPENFDDWITAGIAARLIRQSEAELNKQVSSRGTSPCPHGVLTIGRFCCGLPNNCSLNGKIVPSPE